MPVDELLERKEELEKELPPEGKKLFVLMERLFGKVTLTLTLTLPLAL